MMDTGNNTLSLLLTFPDREPEDENPRDTSLVAHLFLRMEWRERGDEDQGRKTARNKKDYFLSLQSPLRPFAWNGENGEDRDKSLPLQTFFMNIIKSLPIHFFV